MRIKEEELINKLMKDVCMRMTLYHLTSFDIFTKHIFSLVGVDLRISGRNWDHRLMNSNCWNIDLSTNYNTLFQLDNLGGEKLQFKIW